jgi:hypothetical protein
MRHVLICCGAIFQFSALFGQGEPDSAGVVKRFNELAAICHAVSLDDPNAIASVDFRKAASYFVYRGDDEKRKWKDTCNYDSPDEKTSVDRGCFRVKRTLGKEGSYTIKKYSYETESEGTWHLLYVSYMKDGVPKEAVFAFLFVKGRYAIGDID